MNLTPRQKEELKRALLLLYLREQGREGRGRQSPQTSAMDDIMRYGRQARGLYNTGRSIYDAYNTLTGAGGLTEATNAAWNAAAGQASQQAWNAGADAATNAAGGATTAADGTSSAASGSTAGYLAAAMALYNSYNRFQKNPRDEAKSYEAFTAPGRAVAAFYTAGLSELADSYARKQWGGTMKKMDKMMQNNPMSPVFVPMQASKLWTSDKWKGEGDRIRRLLDAGVEVPEQFQGRMFQQRGLKKSELLNPKYDLDFQGMTPDGWVNNKFQNSRNESDMTYYDLAPYAVWAEKRNDWWKLSDAQRKAITDKAQAVGAVRERQGTLDVDWGKVGDIDQIIAGIPNEMQRVSRAAKGQVARVSPGMYVNDKGQVSRAMTSGQAMKQNYGNRIPRKGKR